MSNISEEKPEITPLGLTFDETVVVRQIQAGNTALFSDLIGRYQDKIYNLACRLTGSPEDASDLAQETFIRAIRSIGQFRGNSRFSTWLIRILINLTNDWKSHHKRHVHLTGQIDPILFHSQAEKILDLSDPQIEAEKHEMHDIFWREIDLLDMQHRQVLLLRDIEQLSYQEIAHTLKISEGTVKSRLFRAREQLRQRLFGQFGAQNGQKP
jgi:RNA polymerase sigma-70 factor (ECF subfamily)